MAALFVAAGALSVRAQQRPYIGFVYPAGGQQNTRFQIRLGGQGLDDVSGVLITGSGVSATIVEYYRRLNNQELQLLNEQLRILRKETLSDSAKAMLMSSDDPNMNTMSDMADAASGRATPQQDPAAAKSDALRKLMDRIEKRTSEFVQTPACPSIASLVIVEVSLAPDAAPGEREIRLVTLRGISNPLAFHVGQVPEHSRKPMATATQQVLGKEAQALRKRPADDVEDRVSLPCTLNGQIASGEMNRYRFEAKKGQRLVMAAKARQLIPYIADAVPGWFQPVLALYDSDGKEVAYSDDYRFKPDPTILFEVPSDGEYVLAIYDAIFRGREDFVYRVSIGETPFVTSIYPLGTRTNAPVSIAVKGWNLGTTTVKSPPAAADARPGLCSITVTNKGVVSNPVPFAVDWLPEAFDKEPNNSPAQAQVIQAPAIVNAHFDKPGDVDVFRFSGRSNQVIVAEVHARRLDSPVDSVIRLTDASGKVLAFNDDSEDLSAGLNTHHADSYLATRLPSDGNYYLHVSDTARAGGEDYAYRLRVSEPEPDFDLRVVPSSLALRARSSGTLTVHALRKDGFTGPIKIALKDPPPGFSANPVSITGTQAVARLTVKTDLATNSELVNLTVIGTAKVNDRELVRQAVPAEDRMQAFFWRHLVPAAELKVMAFGPSYQPPLKRTPPPRPAADVAKALAVAAATTNTASTSATTPATNRPAFSRQQVAGRLRQLKALYQEGLLADPFYDEKVAECEAAQ